MTCNWSHHTPSLVSQLYFTPPTGNNPTARLHDSSYICIWQVEGKKDDAYKTLPTWSSPVVVEAGLTLAGQRFSTPER